MKAIYVRKRFRKAWRRLAKVAADRGISVSTLLGEIIEDYVTKPQDKWHGERQRF